MVDRSTLAIVRRQEVQTEVFPGYDVEHALVGRQCAWHGLQASSPPIPAAPSTSPDCRNAAERRIAVSGGLRTLAATPRRSHRRRSAPARRSGARAARLTPARARLRRRPGAVCEAPDHRPTSAAGRWAHGASCRGAGRRVATLAYLAPARPSRSEASAMTRACRERSQRGIARHGHGLHARVAAPSDNRPHRGGPIRGDSGAT